MFPMRRLRIWHETVYEFPAPVRLGEHTLMLRPREGHDVRIEASTLAITPEGRVTWHRDAHDNSVATVGFSASGPASALVITSEVVIQHFDEAPLDFVVAEHAVTYPFEYTPEEVADLGPYRLAPGARNTVPDGWLARFWRAGDDLQTYVLLENMCRGISEDLEYCMREAPGVQTPGETLAAGTGSCRDYANLFMEGVRGLGLAARFVSGYLHSPPGEDDHGATHAWAEVYLPGAGWKGFDPTGGIVTGNEHIPVAVAARPDAVPPVAGSFTGLAEPPPVLRVRVEVVDL